MRPDLLIRLIAEETGEHLLAMDLDAATAFTAREPAPVPKGPDTIAVIPLQGVLTPNGIRYMGRQLTPGMNTFRAQLEEAVAKPEVGAIVIAVDSPGGTVRGTAETAAAVKAAAAAKPVAAYVDGISASAAYWISAPASQIWTSPSAEVGSLGVMGSHLEFSGNLEKAGIRSTVIRSKSAPFKNEANPFEPLSEAAMAAMQAAADDAEDEFFGAVAAGRKTTLEAVRAGYGRGRMVTAQAALTAGMIDKVGSFADLVGALRTKGGTVRRRFSSLAFA